MLQNDNIGNANQESGVYPWYVLGVMMLAYICSFVDRNFVNLLVPTIKADFGLSDIQISLLQGPAFVVCYVTAGLFISRLADMHSRRNIVVIGMILWCLATAAGSLANTFVMLFVLRIGVGVGEASLTPSATSMLSDIFPVKRLGTAMSLYVVSPFIGGALALIIGGVLLDNLIGRPPIVAPLLGELRPWQASFLIVGLPGLLIAALVLCTIKEPARREITPLNASYADNEVVSIPAVLQYLRDHASVYSRVFVGLAMLSLVGYGFTAWLPTYYLRTFSLSYTEIGNMIGTSIMIGGISGVIVGGVLGDYVRTKRSEAPLLLGMAGAVGTLVFATGVVLAESAELATLLLIPSYFFKVLPVGMGYLVVHLITPNRMRGQVMAILLFVDAMIGLGFGPTLVALFTDFVYRDESMIASSLLSVVGISMSIAFVCFFSVRKSFLALVGNERHPKQ